MHEFSGLHSQASDASQIYFMCSIMMIDMYLDPNGKSLMNTSTFNQRSMFTRLMLKICGICSTWRHNNSVSKDLISSNCHPDDQLMGVRLFYGVSSSNPKKNKSAIGRGPLVQN